VVALTLHDAERIAVFGTAFIEACEGTRMPRLTSALFAFALSFAFLPAARADLIVNGDFSTGDFTGWTVSPRGPWLIDTSNPEGGTGFDAANGCFGGACLTDFGLNGLSQTVADAVSGYYLKFAFSPNQLLSTAPAELIVLWDGATVFDHTYSAADPAYIGYSVGVQGTGSDTVTFLVRNDFGLSNLDDVSLVPEPASLALLGGALVAFGLRRRRKSA
jgi:hypothetical protein